MERPEWWPERWWPGTDVSAPASPPLAGPARSRGSGGDPVDSFLRTLVAAFGSEGLALLRLDRTSREWRVVRETLRNGTSGEGRRAFPARGHPLTWCLREELIVQVPPDRLTGLTASGAWCLAGPVPGTSMVLVWWFPGAPGTSARRALDPALEHLAAIAAGESSPDRPGGENI